MANEDIGALMPYPILLRFSRKKDSIITSINCSDAAFQPNGQAPVSSTDKTSEKCSCG
jgi:hypothetical protein